MTHRLRTAAGLGILGLVASLPSCANVTAAPSVQASRSPTTGVPTTGSTPITSRGVPRPDHVVLVLFENERASQIIGSREAPYINALARAGANFTESYAVTHPSQPNYIALFSGSTHGVTDDSCTFTSKADNEAHQLLSAGYTFTSYAEGLPAAGSKVCVSGRYARKHAPWTNFTNVPASAQQPYTAFPHDFRRLPDVSWVIPDLCNDMHDCSVSTGDSWLKAHLGGYAGWAKSHNSLLIVTFDEDDRTADNRIATVIYGAGVRAGRYDEHITHYSVLATIGAMYGLPRLGNARTALAITNVWK